ncbi:hypothetical protein OIU78_006437 [Salix suchowensis]|nr:hypothetical protein OIU78_006437 [Salix suchowensis]
MAFHELLVQLFIISFVLLQSKHCLSSNQSPIVLTLRTQKHRTPISTPRLFSTTSKPPDKLLFHHNVTLTVSLSAGSPLQNITMVLDTGSELSWLHCKKGTETLTQFLILLPPKHTLKFPAIQQHARPEPVTYPLPVSCDPSKLCHFIISYADASSVEGNLAFETFQVGSMTGPATVFGCMNSGFSSNSEEDAKTTGLMGMNRGSLSFVNQMGFRKFSYCISDRDSSGVLLLGEASFSWLKPLNYTPLLEMSAPLPYFDRVAYSVQLEGIKVSDKVLSLPKSVFVPDHTGAGQTTVDSGEVRGKDSVWCFTFGNSDLLGIESFVIGHHQQQNVWMEYDLENSRIGFAEVRCDLAGQRLGLDV